MRRSCCSVSAPWRSAAEQPPGDRRRWHRARASEQQQQQQQQPRELNSRVEDERQRGPARATPARFGTGRPRRPFRGGARGCGGAAAGGGRDGGHPHAGGGASAGEGGTEAIRGKEKKRRSASSRAVCRRFFLWGGACHHVSRSACRGARFSMRCGPVWLQESGPPGSFKLVSPLDSESQEDRRPFFPVSIFRRPRRPLETTTTNVGSLRGVGRLSFITTRLEGERKSGWSQSHHFSGCRRLLLLLLLL